MSRILQQKQGLDETPVAGASSDLGNCRISGQNFAGRCDLFIQFHIVTGWLSQSIKDFSNLGCNMN